MSEKLYQKIYHKLREQITSGVLAENDKLPTEYELMEQFGVSRVTVIKALNLLKDDGLIRRIPKVGSFVSVSDAAEPCGEKGTIALILAFSSEDAPGLCEAVREEAAKHGYHVMLYNTRQSVETEQKYLKSMLEREVAGVICYPVNGEYENLSDYRALKKAGVPLVTVDKRVWQPDGEIPCVTTDNRKAAREITSWVIGKGHCRIGYCYSLLIQANARYRFKGYAEALMEHDIEYDSALVGEMDARLTQYRSSDSVYRQFLEYLTSLPEPPTALICENDVVALRIMRQAKSMGIRIPDQLSVTGFDNLYLCEMLDVPLTTMEQNFSEIGREAVRQLLKEMDGGRADALTLFDAKRIERDSVCDRAE
ncbi:MAG: GntR family transcriptional regulator [Ruminococcaceae bacterium]|nr:GntR family transcriptional regulator [Oscillospiraceae bacterium]